MKGGLTQTLVAKVEYVSGQVVGTRDVSTKSQLQRVAKLAEFVHPQAPSGASPRVLKETIVDFLPIYAFLRRVV